MRINPYTIWIPVVFNNLWGYDSYLIIQALGTITEELKLVCVPNNMEKYMSFSVGYLQFIDSLQFLNSSLDKLVAKLELPIVAK